MYLLLLHEKSIEKKNKDYLLYFAAHTSEGKWAGSV